MVCHSFLADISHCEDSGKRLGPVRVVVTLTDSVLRMADASGRPGICAQYTRYHGWRIWQPFWTWVALSLGRPIPVRAANVSIHQDGDRTRFVFAPTLPPADFTHELLVSDPAGVQSLQDWLAQVPREERVR